MSDPIDPIAAPVAPLAGAEKKVPAGVLAIVAGGLGIHKFYLGYTTAGIITICVTVFTCGAGGAVMGILGLIEGITYLRMSDADFVATYITAKKEWL